MVYPYNPYNPYQYDDEEEEEDPFAIYDGLLAEDDAQDDEEQALLELSQPSITPAVEPETPIIQEPTVTPTPSSTSTGITSWADEPIDEPEVMGPGSQYIQTLRDMGLWGPQYGAPIGQGDVRIGGGISGGDPGYITSARTSGGRAGSPSSSGPINTDGTLPPKMDTSSREANLRQWAPALARVQAETGLDAGALGAIILAENGGGQSDLAKNNNNYFSISNVGRKFQVQGASGRFATYETPEDSLNDFIDLIRSGDNGRNPAYLEAWENRADPEKFWQSLIKGKYIVPEPGFPVETWIRNLNAGRDEVSQYIEGDLGSQAARATSITSQAIDNLIGVTPSQAAYAKVDPADGWSVCGPIAAVGVAKSMGIELSIEDAKAAAAKNGWTSEQGMAGVGSYVQTLKDLGINSQQSSLNWDTVKEQVQAGKMVTLSAASTGGKIGHYFNVEGYDPTTGKFYLGNSLLSLNSNIHGGNAWVTPEELNSMQARTRLNMQPEAMVIVDGAGSGVPRTSSAPTGSRSTPGTTTFTQTEARPLTQPATAIRADVGNRPLTLWDIALGTWETNNEPVAPAPTKVTVEQAPAQQPAWLQQRAAQARQRQAQEAAAPAGPDPAQVQALEEEGKATETWKSQIDGYIAQISEVSRANAQAELDYRNAVNAQAESGQSPLEAGPLPERPVPVPMPEPPPLPNTPLIDAAITAENTRRLGEWQDNGAKGQPPETIRPLSAIRAEIQAQASQADADNVQGVADRYLRAVSDNYAERNRISGEIRDEMDRQASTARAATLAPNNEYARMLEANQAGPGEGSVTVNGPSVMPEGPVPVVPQTATVYSRPEEIDAIPEPDGPTRLEVETPIYEAHPDWGTEQFQEAFNQEYARRGMMTSTQKARLKADLAADQARNTQVYNESQAEIRNSIYMSPELTRSVIEQQYGKPYEETTPEERQTAVSAYREANRPPTYETQTTLGRELSILGEGAQGAAWTFGSGIQGVGNILNIPSLEEWGAKQAQAANEAAQGSGSFLGYPTAKVDPNSLNLAESALQAVPSVITSVGTGIVTGLASAAIGVGTLGSAVIAGGTSAFSTFLQEGGAAYADARKERATDSQATAALLATGSLNAALEALPIGRVGKAMPGLRPLINQLTGSYTAKAVPLIERAIVKLPAGQKLVQAGINVSPALLKNFLAEGGQEALQEVSTIVNQSWYKEQSTQQIMKQIYEQAPTAFAVGGILGVGTEVVGKGATNIPSDKWWAPVYAAVAQERSGTQPDSPMTPNVPVGAANLSGVSSTQLPSPDSISPAPQGSNQYVQGVGQRLFNARENREDGSLQANVSPEFENTLINEQSVPQDFYEGTADVGKQSRAAVVGMAQAEATKGQPLTADERSAVLNHYGIQDATQRHIVALASNHVSNVPGDADVVQQALRDVYGNAGTPTTLEAFIGAVERNANLRPAPSAEMQRAPLAPDAQRILDQYEGRTPAADPNVRSVIGPDGQATPMAQATPAQIQAADPVGPQPARVTSTPVGNPGGATVDPTPTLTNIPRAPTAPGTTQKPNRIPVGTPVRAVTPEPASVPAGAANAPVEAATAAPGGVTTVSANAVPANVSIIDGNAQVSPKPSKDSPMGKLRAAIRKNAKDESPIISEILSTERKEKGAPLTMNEVVDAVTEYFGPSSDLTAILKDAGIDGVSQSDGSVKLMPHVKPVASAPARTPKATGKKGAKAAPKGKKVYMQIPAGGAFGPEMDAVNQPGYNPAQGREGFTVSETAAPFTREGFTAVPMIVDPADIKTAENGSLYIDSPGGTYTPMAIGDAAVTSTIGEINEAPIDAKGRDSAAHIDLLGRVAVPDTDQHVYFQNQETDAATRESIANRPYMTALAKRFGDVHGKVVPALRSVFTTKLVPDSTFSGVAWMPGVLGVTQGRVNAQGEVSNPRIYMNVHGMYNQALTWAKKIGVKEGSSDFRTILAGLYVDTMIHETAHTVTTTQVDASGHGGQHSIAIQNVHRTADVAAWTADMYAALTPQVMKDIKADMETLTDTIGKTIDDTTVEAAPDTTTAVPEAVRDPELATVGEEASVVSPEEAQEVDPAAPVETPTGLRLIDGDLPSGRGRPAQRLLARIRAGLLAVAGDTDSAKMIRDFERTMNGQAPVRGVPGRVGAASSLRNVFNSLFEAVGDDMTHSVMQRLGIDGYTYTDADGNERSEVFPHATERGQNATVQPGGIAATGAGDSVPGRGTTGRRSGRPRADDVPINRTKRTDVAGGVRDGSGEVSAGTNVPGTIRDDGGLGYVEPRTGSGVGRQRQPPPIPSTGYQPGTNVDKLRDSTGKLIRVAPEDRPKKPPVKEGGKIDYIWSDSMRKWVKTASAAEKTFFAQLEEFIDTPGPKGRALEWATDTDFEGNKIGVPHIIEAENRYGSFDFDTVIAWENGEMELVEVKAAGQEANEETRLNAPGEKPRKGWHVVKKLQALGAYLPFMYPGHKTTARIISSNDPSLTGRNITAPAMQKYHAFITEVNKILEAQGNADYSRIADPERRFAASYKAVYRPILDAAEKHLGTTTGRVRNAAVTTFIADPTDKTGTLRGIDSIVPGGHDIISAHLEEYGLTLDTSTVGSAATGVAQTGIVRVTGPIHAAEKLAGELAKAAGVASDPRTFVFHQDSLGRDLLHTMTILDAEPTLSSALDSLETLTDGPTVITTNHPDGSVNTVTMTSRTPTGGRVAEQDFVNARDNVMDIIEALDVQIVDDVTTRGNIVHFDDAIEGGVDNAISRRRELLGETLIGRNFPKNGIRQPLPVGPLTGNPIEQFESRRQSPNISQQEEAIPDFGGIGAEVSRAKLVNAPGTPRQQRTPQQIAADAAAHAARMQQRADAAAFQVANPGQPLPPHLAPPPRTVNPPRTPQQRAVAAQTAADNAAQRAANAAIIPDLDLKKFSKEAQGPIRAAAQAVMAMGGPPPNTRDKAMAHLGFKNRQQFNNSPAANLSDIELAAINHNLEAGRAQMDGMARTISLRGAGNPVTREELRDFIQLGIRFQAMHTQLTGNPGTIRQGSRLYTQARQNTARGETVDQHTQRILNYANTKAGQASQFAAKFIDAFHNMSILGANSATIAGAWDKVITPKTQIGDWFIGIMYSAMLGPSTAVVAAATNTAEIMWRAARDLGVTAAMALKDPESASKILAGEAMGFTYGALQGVHAFAEVIAYGATAQQLAMQDIPHHRLQNNDLGVFSPVANYIGIGLETFWGRFFTGADAFAKTWAYSMQMGREAAMQAQRVSPNGQFTMADVSHWYNNPTSVMQNKSQRVALETAFQGEMGKTGELLANVQNIPVFGRILFPFLRTIYHGLARSVDRSFIGFFASLWDAQRTAPGRTLLERTKNIRQSDYARGIENHNLQAVRPMGERMIDSVVGTAATMALYGAVKAGEIVLTGAAPDDEEERDQWQRDGKTPYSFSIHGSPYRTYQNWGPMNLALAGIAEIDAADKKNELTNFNKYGIAAANFTKALLDMSFMSTLTGILDASDPAKGDNVLRTPFGRTVENLIMSRMPFAATGMGLGRSQDDYVRYPDETEDWQKRLAQSISAKIPMHVPFSETLTGQNVPLSFEVLGQKLDRQSLHPSLDVWGFPVVNSWEGWGAWNPFRSATDVSDHVDDEVQRVAAAGDKSVLPNRAPDTYEGYKFTKDEAFEWKRRVGQDSYARVAHLMNSPEYQSAPDSGAPVTKATLIKDQYREAQKTAWDSLALTNEATNPTNRQPKYYGLEQEAAKRGVSWPQLEKDIDEAKTKWNDYRDAIKNGRKAPVLSPTEIQLATIYSNPSMTNKAYQMERDKAQQTRKRVDDTYQGIPFNALP